MSHSSKDTSFTAERVNSTTFLIIEDDSYGERPRIYALLHPGLNVLVLSDTGCDSPREKDVQIPHLRTFLEEIPIPSNNNKPLNPGPNHRAYIILCSHCHYDHIGGIEQFSLSEASSFTSQRKRGQKEKDGQKEKYSKGNDSLQERETTIISSSLGRRFIEEDLPTHSLCRNLGIRTPVYKVSHWAQHLESLQYPLSLSSPSHPNEKANKVETQQDLAITILQTPGHTPDSLTWYDHLNRHIYIGDTAYFLSDTTYFLGEQGENMPIIFPKEGDWVIFMRSLLRLLDFVLAEDACTTTTTAASAEAEGEGEGEEKDGEGWVIVPEPVKLSAAHTTTSVHAAEFLGQVISFFEDVIARRVEVEREWVQRGEIYCLWSEGKEGEGKKKEGRFAVEAPRRLWEDIRIERGLNGTLKNVDMTQKKFREESSGRGRGREWR